MYESYPQTDHFFEVLENESLSSEAIVALSGLRRMMMEQAKMIDDIRSRLATAEKLSLTDPLTELGNRRAFDNDIQEWAIRLNRGKESRAEDTQEHPHALLAIGDLDEFKLINDVLGYNYGDRVLYFVAHALRESTRHQDKLYRIGGDEFAILAPVMPGKEVSAFSAINQRFHDNLLWLKECRGKSLGNIPALKDTDIEALDVLGVTFAFGVFTTGRSEEELIEVSESTMQTVKELKHAKSANMR